MDVLLGAIAIAAGVFLVVRRHSQAQGWIDQRNRGFALLRMKRRYGEEQLRHNVRAAVIVGVFGIILGFMLIADINI